MNDPITEPVQQTLGGVDLVDNREVLGSADTPRPSDVTAAPAPSSSSSGSLVDIFGTTFDPVRHSVDKDGNPRKTARGSWRRRTGNGALKARGQPMVGFQKARNFQPKDPSTPAPSSAAPAADVETPAPAAGTLPGGSTYVPPRLNGPTAGETDAGADAKIDEGPIPLTADDYRVTSQSIVDGVLGILRMWRGEHWAATAPERSQLCESISRVWELYQLPRLGPVVSLIMVVISFIAAVKLRMADMGSLWDWLLGRKKSMLTDPAAAAKAA